MKRVPKAEQLAHKKYLQDQKLRDKVAQQARKAIDDCVPLSCSRMAELQGVSDTVLQQLTEMIKSLESAVPETSADINGEVVQDPE